MTISVDLAQLSLKELVQKASQGETIILTQGDKPVAEIRPVTAGKPSPKFGSCKGMLSVIADDDEHLADFAEYMK
jgi:antitoxin (DNA-binding transcriptional repressor) of toxin-antitoxin stability system